MQDGCGDGRKRRRIIQDDPGKTRMAPKKAPRGGRRAGDGGKPGAEQAPHHLPGGLLPQPGRVLLQGGGHIPHHGKRLHAQLPFLRRGLGTPSALDANEPLRLAEEVKRLGLRFVVVTSVTRDDLPDGGAGHFARVIEVMRRECPGVGIEVLIPDFQGSRPALKTVVDAAPEVLNHNVETVPRLYASVRPQANYRRSIEVLREAKAMNPSLTTKSGLMLGLGETREEVLEVMVDLRSASCDVITIGQYLSPSAGHHPVVEYVKPEIFEKYHRDALRLGFRDAASSPFVRSSYMAEKYYRKTREGDEG